MATETKNEKLSVAMVIYRSLHKISVIFSVNGFNYNFFLYNFAIICQML
jgi:hypothetical protein